MDIRYTDKKRTVDEDAYLRDFVRAVEHKDLQYVTFVVPIILAQKSEVVRSNARNGVPGGYYDIATEDCSRYDFILSHGLIVASHCGELTIVKFLVEQGTNVNARNADGDSALIKACERGHVDVVRYLLGCPDIDVNITNMVGSSALHNTAKLSDRWQIMDALLSVPHIDVDSTAHKRGKSALHAAAERDWTGRNVRLLLDRGAFVNVADLHGRTPLHDAAARGAAANVALLLRYGAHPNVAETTLGLTALHEAARNGHAAIVMQLVAAGADPELRTRSHSTALDETEVRAKLCGDVDLHFGRIREFLVNEASRVMLSERHRMLRVFDKLCSMFRVDDNWESFFLTLFCDSEQYMQDVMGQVPCQACDASLTVIVHFLLHRWLTDFPHTATLFVLCRALRDHGMPRLADQTIEKFTV